MNDMSNYNIKNNATSNGISRKGIFVVLLFVAFVAIDQLVKVFIFENSTDLPAHGIFDIIPFRNSNFAFSVHLPVSVMYGIYFLVLVSAVVYVQKKYQEFTKQEIIAWTFIFAGALSNIGERIVLGYVRDFLYIASGIFNVADGYILVGIFMLLFVKSTDSEDNVGEDKS